MPLLRGKGEGLTEEEYEDEIYGLQYTIDSMRRSYLRLHDLAQKMHECILCPDPKCNGCRYLHGYRCEVTDLYRELIGYD